MYYSNVNSIIKMQDALCESLSWYILVSSTYMYTCWNYDIGNVEVDKTCVTC